MATVTPVPGSAREVYERVVEVERRCRLFDHQIEGWCAWPMVRAAVANNCVPGLAGVQLGAASQRWRLGLAAGDVWRLALLRRAPLLVKTYSSGLVEERDGSFEDIWFDAVLLAAGRSIKVESVNNAAFLARRRRSARPSDVTTTLADFVGQSVMTRLPTPRDVARVARDLTAVVRDEFGAQLSEASLQSVFTRFLWDRRIYGRILDRVRPTRIVVADYGEYGLVAAAKERGILVYELQHGVNDRYHPAYSWTDEAARYGERMPVADRMLVYGEYWASELSVGGYWPGHLDIVGSTRIDRYREQPRPRTEGPPMACFTSQGIDTAATIDLLREFLAASATSRARLVIKLHPVFVAANSVVIAAFRGEPRVSVFAGSEGPSTFDLIRAANLHVSISSAAHFDSLSLGTPTAILELASHNTVLPLHASGHAALVGTGLGLATVLEEARETQVPQSVREYYSRSGALANILHVLDIPQ